MYLKNHFYKVVGSFLLFALPAAAQLQPAADSALMAQATNAFYIASQNADSAMQLARYALEQGEKTDNRELVANASNTIGWAYLHKGRLDSAIISLQKSKAGFAALQSHEDVIKVNINMAEVHNKQQQYAPAIQLLLEADSLSNRIKSILLQTDVKRSMGVVYRQAGDYGKAVAYFNQALNGFELQEDHLRYTNTLISMSILYRSMKHYDSSFAFLQKGLQTGRQHNLPPYNMAMLHENLAETYYDTEQYAEALKQFFNAYTIFKEIRITSDMAYESYCIGKTYTKLQQYPLAETYLLESYRLSDSLKIATHTLDAAQSLADMYRQWEQWQKAYDFLQITIQLKDSLGLAEQLKQTTEIKEKYEAEKREAEIQLLHEKNRQTKWWFLSSFLIAILVGLLFWLRSYRRRIKEEKILNYFATSLYNQNTAEDVFWDIAKNCISRLNFEDCVIYGYDASRKMLVQKAAFGPKNPSGHVISNLIEIPLGQGIVGTVAATLQPEIVNDTSKDPRYIVDDAARRSEITVPVILEGKLLGIIDSEHSKKSFYTKRDLKLLQKIADICSKKITRYFVEESLRRQIASDLHDDMGSTLSSINIISRLSIEKNVPEDYLVRQMSRISDHTLKMMESLSDMVWAINPVNDNADSMVSKMKEWAGEICENAGVVFQFEANAEILSIPLNADKRKNVFLIFKEAVNNAVKYSGCTEISAGVGKNRTGQLLLFVRDNGEGFEEASVKKGNGLNNMKERASLLDAVIVIKSLPGKGTSITLTFVAEETATPIFGEGRYK